MNLTQGPKWADTAGMRVAWLGVGAAAFVLLMTFGVSHRSPAENALSAAGCHRANSVPEHSVNKIGLTVVGPPCVNPDGSVLDAGRSADLMAAVAWRSPTQGVDSLRVAVCKSSEGLVALQGCLVRSLSHAELRAAYGPRDPSLDGRDWMKDAVTAVGWLLLPPFLLGGIAIAVWAGVRMARSGLVIIRLPR